MSEHTLLADVSDQLAAAVEQSAQSTVLVSARRRIPASGIAWSADGLVLTTDHALETEEGIRVVTPAGAEHDATIVGRDPGSDLALLRVAGATLTPAVHAPDDSYRTGSLVLAVARPSTEGPMASFGIVSAVGGAWRTRRRTRVSSYLRTDTTFFPGFSGGPLVDVAGRVIGINSSRLGRGAGLTIPLSAAEPVIADLLNRGRVRRPYLGVSSQVVPLPPPLANVTGGQESALLVVMVEQGSPADTAGIGIGDILVRIDDAPLPDTEALQAQLTPERIGNAARFTILRGGAPSEVTITPAERTW
jgi:S1-C subfamily serine protease